MNTEKLVILSLDDVLINIKKLFSFVWTENLEADFHVSISPESFASRFFHLNALDIIRELDNVYNIVIPKSYIIDQINPTIQEMIVDHVVINEDDILSAENLKTGSYKIAAYTKLNTPAVQAILNELDLTNNINYIHKISPNGLRTRNINDICKQTNTNKSDAVLVTPNISDIKFANIAKVSSMGVLEHHELIHVKNAIKKATSRTINSNTTLRAHLAAHFR